MPAPVRRPRPPRLQVQGITPFLWFRDQAEPAARFYVSLFRGAKLREVRRAGPGRTSPVIAATISLGGTELMLFNGGPPYRLSPAFSLSVDCAGQREVDALWRRLLRGGRPSRCGWLVDRYGVSWQIIPRRLTELLSDPDPTRARRALEAMLTMTKIDVAKLERAVRSA